MYDPLSDLTWSLSGSRLCYSAQLLWLPVARRSADLVQAGVSERMHRSSAVRCVLGTGGGQWALEKITGTKYEQTSRELATVIQSHPYP